MLSKSYKKNFIRAGEIANQVRSFGKSLIQSGTSYNSIVAKINQKILDFGAIPAFPPQMALNDVAAHFLPEATKDITLKDEVVKLDVGICYQGAIGDCAVTVDLSGHHQKLIESAESALLNAEKSIKVGQPIREIGKIIAETIVSYGYQPVRNLSGHGLGIYKVHTSPIIPNYDDHSPHVIKPGMTFAIEPFATTGKGIIYEKGAPQIFSLLKAKPSLSKAHASLLRKIMKFKGLPFSLQEIASSESSLLEVQTALSDLMGFGVIGGYAPLVEISQGTVAQAENSVLVDEEGNVFVTTR